MDSLSDVERRHKIICWKSFCHRHVDYNIPVLFGLCRRTRYALINEPYYPISEEEIAYRARRDAIAR